LNHKGLDAVAYLAHRKSNPDKKFFDVMSPLTTIKITHTVVWLFFNVVLFYMAYAVIINKIDKFVWIGVALIVLEGIVLLLFGKMCPLTIMARKYSDSTKDNFDIYLPRWLAKHNKLIYTSFFIVIVLGIIYRSLNP
jgi:hypothetical protein